MPAILVHARSRALGSTLPGRFGRTYRVPGFRALWLAAVAFAASEWMERLAIGWLILDRTDSFFLTTASFAARMAPSMVLGPVGGTLVDRLDRRSLLAGTAAAKALIAAALAGVVLGGAPPLPSIFVLAALSGSAMTLQIGATQATIRDLVGPDDHMTGVGLNTLGTRAVGVVAGLIGGGLIALAGAPATFSLGAGIALVAAVAYLAVPRSPRRSLGGRTFRQDLSGGIRLLIRSPLIRSLLVLAIAVEILAFSYMSVLPVVARELVHVGPAGLGGLSAAVGVGALLGSLAVALLPGSARQGVVLLAVVLGFGASLVGLGASTVFVASLVLVTGTGAMAVMFDALQWIVLQKHVADEERGRALGGWVMAIGFGWLGHLAIGGVSAAVGVQWALIVNGLAVAAVGLGAAASASLRRA